MSIAFHQTAKISAGIIFQFGIFIRLRALSPFVGRVKRVGLTMRRSLPDFTCERTGVGSTPCMFARSFANLNLSALLQALLNEEEKAFKDRTWSSRETGAGQVSQEA